MLCFVTNLKLNAKVALLGAGSVLITAIVLVALAVWQSGRYHTLAQREVDKLIDADLDHIAQGVCSLVRTENEAVQQQLDDNLKVARHVLANAGDVSLAQETVTWTALNQFTRQPVKIQLPKMLAGGHWLGRNADPAVETGVVDEVTRLIGETATIFQRMNGNGDMLRVATTVRDAEGRRAIGSYIPAVNPDGTPNPVTAAVLKGETYRGRAFVVNAWHLTAYEPIQDREGKLVGMLYVGVRQKSVEARVRQAILQTKVGKTGYVYVLGGRGEERGHYMISQRGERDGEDIWGNTDSDGRYVIQAIVGKAIALKPGELATERYRWQNADDRAPRWKIVRLAYYAPWDWVIGTSVYEDELQDYRKVLSGGRIRMTRSMVLAGLAITLLIGLVGILIAWTIANPVQQITRAAETIIQGDLNQVVDIRSRDEVGVLANTFNFMTAKLKKTLEGLRESEERYRHLFERVPVGLYRATPVGQLREANAALVQMLGYPDRETLLELNMLHLYAASEDRGRWEARIEREGVVRNFEVQLRRRDGTPIWVSHTARVERADDGQVRYYEGSLEDMTVRKRAEESLRESERRLSQIIDFLPDATFGIDMNGNVIAWNRAIEEMTGVKTEEMLGKGNYEYALPFYGIRRPILIDLVFRPAEEITKKYLFVRKEGDCLFAEAEVPVKRENRVLWGTARPLFDSRGNMVGAIESIRDITERKRAEWELRNHRDHLEDLVRERTAELLVAKDKAEVASRAKSAFLANMSHELRTPLNAILGYAQILKRDPNLSDRQTSALATIRESGEHLLTLITDILDLSRIEAGKLELQTAAFNLPSFLRVVANIIRVKAELKSLLFVCALAPDLPKTAQADEKRLRQVLLNLLGNAVKFTDHGQVTLRVRGEDVKREGSEGTASHLSRLTFQVEDTGIGMTDEQRARLFRPFEQLAEVRRREGGAGLGLAISRQLVRLMGGEIQVAGEPGKGSRFWFELELPILDTEIVVPAAERVVIGYEGPRKKVLVVDDAPANRAVLADALAALGFEVREAENGEGGLVQTEAGVPDLVVMDVMMPVMDGREATRRLRQMSALQNVPVIAVSASAATEDRERALASGANAFLAKPIELDGLLKVTGELLGLTWVCRPVEAAAAEATPSKPLVPPPPEDLRVLYDLALRGNMREIREQAERLVSLGEEYHPFVEKLRRMADQFKSKAILALVKQHRNQEKPF